MLELLVEVAIEEVEGLGFRVSNLRRREKI